MGYHSIVRQPCDHSMDRFRTLQRKQCTEQGMNAKEQRETSRYLRRDLKNEHADLLVVTTWQTQAYPSPVQMESQTDPVYSVQPVFLQHPIDAGSPAAYTRSFHEQARFTLQTPLSRLYDVPTPNQCPQQPHSPDTHYRNIRKETGQSEEHSHS